MSEQKHAPFPWKTSYDGHGGICIEAADGSQVGFVSSGPHQEANARLIEAVPDLLEALRDAEEALTHLQDRLAVRVNPPTLEKMRAAISKALSS